MLLPTAGLLFARAQQHDRPRSMTSGEPRQRRRRHDRGLDLRLVAFAVRRDSAWKSMSAMTKPSTASPRNSSDSLSMTPPDASSCARDRCVSACSSRPSRGSGSRCRSSSGPRVSAQSPNFGGGGLVEVAAQSDRAPAPPIPPARSRETPSDRIARETPTATSADPTFASIPWASSRPRTTSASIDEWVRKMIDGRPGESVRRSQRPYAAASSLTLSTTIVMSSCGSASPTNASHLADARARECRRRPRSACRVTTPSSAASPKSSPFRLHGLGDAIGVEHDHVAGAEWARVLVEHRVEPVPGARQPQPEHHPPTTSRPRHAPGSRR